MDAAAHPRVADRERPAGMILKRRDRGIQIQTFQTVTVADIVRNSSRADLIQFIKDIEFTMADWSFTLPLCEYFAELKKQHEKEEAADKAKETRAISDLLAAQREAAGPNSQELDRK